MNPTEEEVMKRAEAIQSVAHKYINHLSEKVNNTDLTYQEFMNVALMRLISELQLKVEALEKSNS